MDIDRALDRRMAGFAGALAVTGNWVTRAWFAPVVFVGLAIVWTWPAAISGEWVGRHSDTLGTIWTLSAARRLVLGGMHDVATGFPDGATYLRPDSFVLLAIGAVFGPGATRLHAWLQVIGVAGSAWAAEDCARRLGANRPASMIAGFSFAFSGLASTTLLEGHVYHLLDPWLPICLWTWWRATGPAGRIRDGVGAGFAYAMALFSTAYLGLAAAVVLVGVALGGLIEGRHPMRWRPVFAALGVGVPVSLLYVWAFAGGGPADAVVTHGPSAQLANMLGPTETIDAVYHSHVVAIPATVLALFFASPVVLRGVAGWRRVAAAGVLALVLSMGATFSVDHGDASFALPLALLAKVQGGQLVRFPARLAWGWALCAGVVAARVGGELVSRWRPAGWVLASMLLVDAFAQMGMPSRQRVQPAAIPSAYLSATGPILDLFPVDIHRTQALDLRVMTMACAYQTVHHRAIADLCITTTPWEGPRARFGQELWEKALIGEAIRPWLAGLGFEFVVFHADLFRPGDRAPLREALLTMDAAPVRSRDGGEFVEGYRVAGAGR